MCVCDEILSFGVCLYLTHDSQIKAPAASHGCFHEFVQHDAMSLTQKGCAYTRGSLRWSFRSNLRYGGKCKV
jgi:hypothetical protein